MEDQRNWTDASYKTYVRPLGLPHPLHLAAWRGLQPVRDADHSSWRSRRRCRPRNGLQRRHHRHRWRWRECRVPPRFGMALEARHAAAVSEHGRPARRTVSRQAYLSCFSMPGHPMAAAAMAGPSRPPGSCSGASSAWKRWFRARRRPRTRRRRRRLAAEAGARSPSVAVTPWPMTCCSSSPARSFPDTRDFDALYAAARAQPSPRPGSAAATSSTSPS